MSSDDIDSKQNDKEIDIHIQMVVDHIKGGVSGGTIESAFLIMDRLAWDKEGRQRSKDPRLLSHPHLDMQAQLKQGLGPLPSLTTMTYNDILKVCLSVFLSFFCCC